MFVKIEHGESEDFLVNIDCQVGFFMQYIKTKLGLAESELIDLCDNQGAMKFLFLPQNKQRWTNELLQPRETFIVCSINRSSKGAYTSVTPLLSGVDSALLETLQGQIGCLERRRLKQLCVLEVHVASKESKAPPKTTKKGKQNKN